MSSIARKSSLLFMGVAALLTLSQFVNSKVESPFLHNPLRIRVNSELIRNVFHKRDQDILKIVKDLELGTFAIGDANIQNL